MKKQYNTPKLTEFGTVAQLTQYGSTTGADDSVYFGNPLNSVPSNSPEGQLLIIVGHGDPTLTQGSHNAQFHIVP